MYVYAKITDNRLTLEAHPDLSTLGDNTRDRLAHITTVNGSASARFASDHPSSRFPAVAPITCVSLVRAQRSCRTGVSESREHETDGAGSARSAGLAPCALRGRRA